MHARVLAASLLTLVAAAPGPATAAEKLPVVASFSILGDMVARVGGEHIALTTLIGPDGDAHVFSPRPVDAEVVGKAKVMIVNGLGFEGWLDRLVEASGSKASIVTASAGVKTIEVKKAHEGHAEDKEHAEAEESSEAEHGHGDVDPHAWQDVRNAVIYVGNITQALCEADKASCDAYKANGSAYIAELEALDAKIRTAIEAVPADRRAVITSHDAFGYFESAYGITFLAPEGVSTESEASAADVAKLIEQIREDKASAIFVENVTNPRLIERIGKDTGVKVGGTLYSDALSGSDGPAATYLDMMRHNAETLTRAIAGT